MADVVPGFEVVDGTDDGVDKTLTRRLVADQNRRKSKSGGFQVMGFSSAVLKGVAKRGYRVPTPIQRRCIPLIMDGRDVVAMARTGSGKTACFLLPLLERLQASADTSGVRALVISPTRELALQTVRFAQQLGRFCQLQVAAILGGEAMDEQFAAVHARPDVLVATPGRLVHICLEMRLRLSSLRYVVFDEADRLFELGFAEQLREILARLPDSRQTLLFSATMPSALAEFARAGLNEPTLVRLDTEQQLSARLQLVHVQCRQEERSALLLLLLRQLAASASAKTLVFVATRHHVEYVRQLLQQAGLACSHLYSSMDPEARRCNADRFCCKGSSSVNTMIVTDVAARGIDIPHLDNVINFNFPARPKLFVHRVGRVARAGRSGTAYSLLSPAELPFLLDLCLFLGQPLLTCSSHSELGSGQLGAAPQQLIDSQLEQLRLWHEQDADLVAAQTVSQNAHKQYVRTRPAASRESVRRAKQLLVERLWQHPVFAAAAAATGAESQPFSQLLDALRSYKSSKTIFEVGARRGQQSEAARVMVAKRKQDAPVLQRASQTAQQRAALCSAKRRDLPDSADGQQGLDLLEDFKQSGAKKAVSAQLKSTTAQFRDNANYIRHFSERCHAEAGYSISENFNKDSGEAVLDLTTDDSEQMNSRSFNKKHWDLNKRRYVGESNDGKDRKVKTESGVWVPASFQRSGRYDQWKKKNRTEACENRNSDDEDASQARPSGRGVQVLGRRFRARFTSQSERPETAVSRPARSELRSNDQILKRRQAAERRHRRSTVGVSTRGARGVGRRGSSHSSRVGRMVLSKHSKSGKFAARGSKALRTRKR